MAYVIDGGDAQWPLGWRTVSDKGEQTTHLYLQHPETSENCAAVAVVARQDRVLLAVLGDFLDERELDEGMLGEVGLGSHTRVQVPAGKRGATSGEPLLSPVHRGNRWVLLAGARRRPASPASGGEGGLSVRGTGLCPGEEPCRAVTPHSSTGSGMPA